MELRDLIVTPIWLIVIYVVAYVVRPYVTDSITRKYFLPALTVRIIGALAVGLLYQFYYGGGDTFNFHTHGSRHIWNAFIESPELGMKLIFSNGEYTGGTYPYASKIIFFRDPSSFFVVRTAALFDLLTFSSYSATAVLFAVISFAGAWFLFLAFYQLKPYLIHWLAVACLFIPSVVFWGSGLLKDTLTFSAVGFITFTLSSLLFKKKISLSGLLLLVAGVWILFSVKKYILMCFLPAVLIWYYGSRFFSIRSIMLRTLIAPVLLVILLYSGYQAIVLIGEDDPRYAVENIAMTAKITAYDIGFYTGRDAGSSYSLGELDGTFEGMISKIPQAINVSLFRPYLWEVRNPLMLISAVESFAILLLTLYILFYARSVLHRVITNPLLLFCILFSLTFAFAVGVSTFNFGTLVRYKIPMIPFYIIALGEVYCQAKSFKKFSSLADTEK